MNKRYTFRASGDVQDRIAAIAEKAGKSCNEIVKIAIDVGLANLESGRHINIERQILVLEITAAYCDIIAKTVAPELAELVAGIGIQRLDQYHGKI